MEPITTTQQLAQVLQELLALDRPAAPESYRYVLYARKSTESEERQARSLGDQIDECKKLAASLGLTVACVVNESESAKEPDIRPKFRAMMDEVKKGKYDGILCWHPDRLSRNMKEAGEIIDLLDKSIIKDLKFCSFTFENNASGKMLLGLAFVLSKQYSDKLSDDVSRGVRKGLESGKTNGKVKHGYYRDRNQLLRPDMENFHLIKRAWEMRLEKTKTLDEIADFLNRSGYQRSVGIGGGHWKRYTFTKKILSELFRDPFYAGVFKYGNHVVDLNDVYDFTPMITADEFAAINAGDAITRRLKQRFRVAKADTQRAHLLNGMVVCGHCGQTLSAGITVKKNKERTDRYFYYRCETLGCPFENKSVRARVVLDFAQAFLDEHSFGTPESYAFYRAEMKRKIALDKKRLDARRRQLFQEERQLEEGIEQVKRLLLAEANADEKDLRTIATFKTELKAKEDRLASVQEEKARMAQGLALSDEALIEYETFLELMNSIPDTVRKIGQMSELDFYLRKIFSNFTVTEKKITAFSLSEPYATFVAQGLVTHGRDTETPLELFARLSRTLESVRKFTAAVELFRTQPVSPAQDVPNLIL